MTSYYKPITIQHNILLLQGSVGPFFKYFARFLRNNKCTVYKINFHYGEQFFYNEPNTVLYKGSVANWSIYLSDLLITHEIQQIFLVGKHKIYHKIAEQLCKEHNIELFVFDEGYIRPNYVTIEQNGVNGDSSLPKDSRIYLDWDNSEYNHPEPSITLNTFARHFNHWRYYYLYSWGLFITQWLIPHYKHHIAYKGFGKFFKWHRSFLSIAFHTIFPFEKDNSSKWVENNINNYYVVMLQINTDSAIKTYSQYNNMEDFILEVLTSFAKYAPKNNKILIKHHPFDRGMNCYKRFIKHQAKQLNILDRVKYITDAHLDFVFENSLGCVVINSTSGLSALSHNTPTIAMSKSAIYNIEGLTYQGSLDGFWTNKSPPNQKLLKHFKDYVIYHTQLHANFYGGIMYDFRNKFIPIDKAH